MKSPSVLETLCSLEKSFDRLSGRVGAGRALTSATSGNLVRIQVLVSAIEALAPPASAAAPPATKPAPPAAIVANAGHGTALEIYEKLLRIDARVAGEFFSIEENRVEISNGLAERNRLFMAEVRERETAWRKR